MKYIFILNRFTLGNLLENLYKKIARYCSKKNIPFKIEINSDTVSTEDIVKKYKNKKVVIIPVGGDGIINRVINAMYGGKAILSFIPYGTGNDYYRSVDKQLKDGLNDIDIVKINNKYFVNVACFGIDSYVANSNIIRKKWIPKGIRYEVSAIFSLFKYKPNSYKIFVNNEVISGTKSTVVVCNGKYYGGGYGIGIDSSVNDGKLELYVMDKMSNLSALLLMLGTNKKKHVNNPKVKKVITNSLIIETDKKINCNIDGECFLDDRFTIEIIAKGGTLYWDRDLIKNILN